MKAKNSTIILAVCCIAVLVLGIPLLGADFGAFLKWWLCALLLGIGLYPLSSRLFVSFEDKGWLFSKALGIALCGFAAYILIACGVLRFTTGTVCAVTLICAGACWGGFFLAKKLGKTDAKPAGPLPDLQLVLLGELLFLILFLMWTYLAGCRPEAYGTEKFMDYGFMAAMMRDDALPARDLWYSQGTINYYYGGQYFAVFLTRLTGTRIQETYNLMRTMVAAFAFVLPFSLVYHLFKNRKSGTREGKTAPTIAGILSGTAVSLAGNMHYVLYGLLGDVFKLSGYEDYRFSSSTRYIGHNPLTEDQCIHEFPSYSFVLGDLHAHMVNLMFVFCLLGILYAWFRQRETEGKKSRLAVLKEPHIWLLGVFLGMFQFTNYWDFVIYLTVVLIALALYFFRGSKSGRVPAFLLRAAAVIGTALLAAAPFNSTFEAMTQGFALSKNHSAFYQLAVLWGLPAVSVLLLFVFVSRTSLAKKRKMRSGNYISNMALSDMFALLMGICAIGLVLVPEVMYARDIYENGYARSNTMFKLTYQAYILFGMSMIYSIFRFLSDVRKIGLQILSAFLLFLFLLTCCYFPYAVKSWFGNVTQAGTYRGLDATAFLETSFASDAEAIRWLNENVEENPVVLEAPGNSYTDYERVSAMTGLPTVRGWHTHEWLWRNDPEDLNVLTGDINTIYTGTDVQEVQSLLEKYEVSYVFVGSCERDAYGTALNEAMLQYLGEVVFQGTVGDQPAYIVRIAQDS